MAIIFVREPSETPNISNIDDFPVFRYAYGNQNGYVQGKGNEVSYTLNGSVIKLNSGRLVIQGTESSIDANGVEITVDKVTTKRYHSVYLEVNLALNTAEIKSVYDTATYPTIDTGDDLNISTTGTARLLLYWFDSQNGVISNVVKKVSKIEYAQEVVDNLKSGLESGSVKPKNCTNADNATNSTYAEYASSDTSKGTIEARLTNLGFKEGTVALSSGTASTNKITRQGNYCILNLVCSGYISVPAPRPGLTWYQIGTIKDSFLRPKQEIVSGTIENGESVNTHGYSTKITTDGNVYISYKTGTYVPSTVYIGFGGMNVGYEANPL